MDVGSNVPMFSLYVDSHQHQLEECLVLLQHIQTDTNTTTPTHRTVILNTVILNSNKRTGYMRIGYISDAFINNFCKYFIIIY